MDPGPPSAAGISTTIRPLQRICRLACKKRLQMPRMGVVLLVSWIPAPQPIRGRRSTSWFQLWQPAAPGSWSAVEPASSPCSGAKPERKSSRPLSCFLFLHFRRYRFPPSGFSWLLQHARPTVAATHVRNGRSALFRSAATVGPLSRWLSRSTRLLVGEEWPYLCNFLFWLELRSIDRDFYRLCSEPSRHRPTSWL